jgi:AraC family transcriptional regulator
VSLTAKLIWYIERHLDRRLSLSRVAEAHGISAFHVTRLFAVSMGQPLMTYVKARRLTEAAKALLNGTDILDAAITAGYGSHEAFTRAFRGQFGLPPREVRRASDHITLKLTEPLSMNDPALHDPNPQPVQIPRFAQASAMMLAGPGGSFRFSNLTGIPGLWQAFRPHFGHIDGQVGGIAYGVSYNYRPDGLDYMAAVEVDGTGRLPDGFTTLKVPAGRYAVFEHHGHVSGISQTWRQIYDAWLPASGVKMRDAPSFERMDERFNGDTGMGLTEIWVPVE